MSSHTGLVIDDDPHVRAIFARVLRAAGMQVFEAASGRAGLTLALTAKPQFVVTDLQMSDGDGLEVCRRLRSDPALCDVAIVVVSGAGQNQRDEAIGAGCDVVLAKPCSPELLVETIRKLLVKPS